MPIHSCAQSFPNSCGAACLVVAIAELNGLPTQIADVWMKVRQAPTYGRISDPAGAGYSWPGLIHQEITNFHGRIATLCEDKTITAPLRPADAASPFHHAYAQHLGLIPAAVFVDNRAFADDAFKNGARVLMAMIRPGGALHYVLGRMDEDNQLVVMDPSDGMPPAGDGHNANVSIGILKSNGFFNLPTPASPSLRFSGIFIRVS